MIRIKKFHNKPISSIAKKMKIPNKTIFEKCNREIQCNLLEETLIPDPDSDLEEAIFNINSATYKESMHHKIELLENPLDNIKIDSNIIIIKTNMVIERTLLIEKELFFSTGLLNSVSISFKTDQFEENSKANIFSNGKISFSGMKITDWQQIYNYILSQIISVHNELVSNNKYVIRYFKEIITENNYIPVINSVESNYIISFKLGFEINFDKLENIFKIGIKFSIFNVSSQFITNYEITEYEINEGGGRKQVKIKLDALISFVIFSSGSIQIRKKTTINNIEPIKNYCYHIFNIFKHFENKICL